MDYGQVYHDPRYRMGWPRLTRIVSVLSERQHYRRSILDVGTGRGELLVAAYVMGFHDIEGTETAPELCTPHPEISLRSLPNLGYGDQAFETVTCLDVLEHLPKEDKMTEDALKELWRVAGKRLILSIGMDESPYHTNLHSAEEWDRLIRKVCDGAYTIRARQDLSTANCIWYDIDR